MPRFKCTPQQLSKTGGDVDELFSADTIETAAVLTAENDEEDAKNTSIQDTDDSLEPHADLVIQQIDTPTKIVSNCVEDSISNIQNALLFAQAAAAAVAANCCSNTSTTSSFSLSFSQNESSQGNQPVLPIAPLGVKPLSQLIDQPSSEPVNETNEEDTLPPPVIVLKEEKISSPTSQQQQQSKRPERESRSRRSCENRTATPITPKPKSRERERELVTCSVCAKLMRQGSLREHMDRHTNSGKFECKVCAKNFSRASAHEKHLRTHTGERPYKCSLCPKAYRQKVHLSEHLRSHTGTRPFVCCLCGFALASKSLLNRHLRTHRVNQAADATFSTTSTGVRVIKRATTDTTKCQIDYRTTTNIDNVWMRVDAPNEEILQMAAKVGKMLTKSDTNDQSDNEQRTANDPNNSFYYTPGRKYLCSLCPAGFPTVQALRSHRMITHNLLTPHKCLSCQEAFSSIKLLKVHLRKNHPQLCPLCSKQMPERRRWMLEVHLRDEHPEASIADVIGLSPLNIASRKRKSELKTLNNESKSKHCDPDPNNGIDIKFHEADDDGDEEEEGVGADDDDDVEKGDIAPDSPDSVRDLL